MILLHGFCGCHLRQTCLDFVSAHRPTAGASFQHESSQRIHEFISYLLRPSYAEALTSRLERHRGAVGEKRVSVRVMRDTRRSHRTSPRKPAGLICATTNRARSTVRTARTRAHPSRGFQSSTVEPTIAAMRQPFSWCSAARSYFELTPCRRPTRVYRVSPGSANVEARTVVVPYRNINIRPAEY